jgi:transglutaminase-like putative cysteine protease
VIDSTTTGRLRPAGISVGALAFAGAWFVGTAIARLTGAAAVLLVLAAALVALGAAALSSILSTRSVTSARLRTAGIVAVNAPVHVDISIDGLPTNGDVVVRVLYGDAELVRCDRSDFDKIGHADVWAVFPTPGIVNQVTIEVITTGAPGLLWTRRRLTIGIDPISVAPVADGPPLEIATASSPDAGVRLAVGGRKDGDVDSVRPWREGEGDSDVHWSSSLRSRTLIVHDRASSSEQRWTLTLDRETIDEATASRLLTTAFEGIRLGHEVVITTAATSQILHDTTAARLFAAHAIGTARSPLATSTPWYRHPLRLRTRHETPRALGPVSRIATACSSLIAIAMLLGALGSDPATLGLIAVGLTLGVVSSLKFGTGSDAVKPWQLRIGIGAATFAALAYVASTVGGIAGLLAALRGPMPDLLMLLLIVHGLEVVDQRAQRVHQAIAGVIVAYAAGLRVDGNVGWWLAGWAIVIVIAVRTSTQVVAPSTATKLGPGRISNRRLANGVGLVCAAAIAIVAVLSVVPVPDGPARLGLPALSNNAPSASTPGALAGPDGNPAAASTDRRGSLSQVGGYPGFSNTLDTSVRGDLGDDLVMRVRASEPAFWRGQTFTKFDGRTWSVAPEEGTRRAGPRIDVPATLGDLPRPNPRIETKDFIQTYYVESDLPNVVFAASRPDVVTFDGSVWTRPDGSMRSNVTLNKGSVYTVVSKRVQVTSDLLQRQGDIAATFAEVDSPQLQERLAPYLALPESTTQRTLDLAATLRQPGDSTYVMILRYQLWLGENTGYDLNAPIPAPGADAVDNFLFESQLGFCEQIASSLAIMLRSQGVPARIATGYVPGVRNRVSGVFEVKASDAHAWVEVWFPDTGWESFDPTAVVPLAGEANPGTVGGDLIGAAISGVASRPVEIGLLAALALLAVGAVRSVVNLVHRRRRGRWGVLQDRFSEMTPPSATTNPMRAASFNDAPQATTPANGTANDVANDVARLLDRAAFDPEWVDDDEMYRRARERVDSLL